MPSGPSRRAPQARSAQPEPNARACRAAVIRFGRTIGRHIAAGLDPAPGVYSRIPVWSCRDRWLDAVRVALADGRICRECHVLPATVLAVARGHARFADGATGRTCRPTNGRLVESCRVSLSTVQRARRALSRAGLIVCVTAGRSIMRRSERLDAWQRGSSHRMIAAEYALTVPRPARARVDGDTPPVGGVGGQLSPVGKSVSEAQQPKDAGPRCARGRPFGRLRRRRRFAAGPPRWWGLASGVKGRVPWLGRIPERSLCCLKRLWAAGWDAPEVVDVLDSELAARGWRVPAELSCPAGYLATLLAGVDPADRPKARRDAEIRAELARRLWITQLRTAPDCAHGTPGGDVPSPTSGVMVCPWCRRAAQ